MANCLLSWNNLVRLNATAVTSSSEVSSLGAARLKTDQAKQRTRSIAGVTAVTYNFDFGASSSVGVLALQQPDDAGAIDADGNATGLMSASDTVRHRLDAVTAGAGALLDTGTGAGNWQPGIGFHCSVLNAAVNARYWQVDINAASLAAGLGYVDMGLAWAGPAWRPGYNFGFGYQFGWTDGSDVNLQPRAGTMFVDQGPRRRMVTFSLNWLNESEAKGPMSDLMRIAGTHQPVLFIPDPASSYVNSQSLIGYLSEASPIEQAAYPQYRKSFQIIQAL